jgi:hypothetical protein
LAIKNYTTEVNEHKTVAEIQGILASKGARAIQIDYENGIPTAVRFIIVVSQQPIPFRLPCNVDGVLRAMSKRYKNSYDQRTFLAKTSARDQARRVAWRIIKDWIDSQMAIVESEQAAMAQVFLPYAEVGKDGLSVYEQFLNSTKALPAGDTVTA